MAILTLPNELLDMILFPHEGISTKSDLTLLFNAASTCKRFREIIIPILYRHLGGLDPEYDGSWDEKSAYSLIRTLAQNPHLCSLIRSLSYTESRANRDGREISHISDRVLLALLSLSKNTLTRAVLGLPRANQKSGDEVNPVRDWVEHDDDGVSFCRFPLMLEKLTHLTVCGNVDGIYRSLVCCIHALLSNTPNIESLHLVDVLLPPDIHLPGSLQSLTLENCRLLRVDRHNGTCDFRASLVQLCGRLICLRIDPRGPTHELELESAADEGLYRFPQLPRHYEPSEWDPQFSALIDEDDDSEFLEEAFDNYLASSGHNRDDIKTDAVTEAVIKIIQSASTTLERIHWGVPEIGYFHESSPRIGSLKLAKLKTISIHCSNLRLVDGSRQYTSNLLKATFEGCTRLEVIELVWDGYLDCVENRVIRFALSEFADVVVEEKGKGSTFNSLKELILVPHCKGERCRLLGNRSLFNLRSAMKVSVMVSSWDRNGLSRLHCCMPLGGVVVA